MNCIKTCRKELGNSAYASRKKSVCGSCVLETWSITKIIENSCFCSKRPIFKYDWFAGDVPTSLENSWKRSHFRNPQRVLPRSQRPFAVRWLSRTCKSLLGIAGEKHNCPERSAVALSAGWRLHFHRRISLLLTTNISFNAIHTDTSCTDFAEVNIHQAPLSLCPSDLKLRWLVWGRGFVWPRERGWRSRYLCSQETWQPICVMLEARAVVLLPVSGLLPIRALALPPWYTSIYSFWKSHHLPKHSTNTLSFIAKTDWWEIHPFSPKITFPTSYHYR